MLANIQNFGSDLWQTIKDIGSDLRKIDAKQLNHLYSMKGLDKIAETSIPILKMFQNYSLEGIKNWLSITRTQRDLYQATLIFPAWKDFLRSPSVNHTLVFMESICKTCDFLYKYEVFAFSTWKSWVHSAQYSPLFQQYPQTKYLLEEPRDIFIFLSSTWKLIKMSQKYYRHFSTAGLSQAQLSELNGPEAIEKRILLKKKKDLLDAINRIGLIVLVILRIANYNTITGNVNHSKLSYNIIELFTYGASFIKLLMR